ncbi:MAG: hypothetical protein JSS53_00505 [Proteobacteria bacterium]|nr:hypothetical protein [Pseudomonadota bacterium]
MDKQSSLVRSFSLILQMSALIVTIMITQSPGYAKGATAHDECRIAKTLKPGSLQGMDPTFIAAVTHAIGGYTLNSIADCKAINESTFQAYVYESEVHCDWFPIQYTMGDKQIKENGDQIVPDIESCKEQAMINAAQAAKYEYQLELKKEGNK